MSVLGLLFVFNLILRLTSPDTSFSSGGAFAGAMPRFSMSDAPLLGACPMDVRCDSGGGQGSAREAEPRASAGPFKRTAQQVKRHAYTVVRC